eukprot:g1030.t1
MGSLSSKPKGTQRKRTGSFMTQVLNTVDKSIINVARDDSLSIVEKVSKIKEMHEENVDHKENSDTEKNKSQSKTATNKSIAVLGSGSYGTALAYAAVRAGCSSVKIYTRRSEIASSINDSHVNPKRFATVTLPSVITASTDIETVLKDVDLIIHAIPSQATKRFLEENAEKLPENVPYVCTAKGICTQTHMLMSELITEILKQKCPEKNVPQVYLSGPSFAKEIIAGHIVGVAIASESPDALQKTQDILGSPTFRIYSTSDVTGVEVGGALKNPLAIGTGMASGLGLGSSTIAMIITRGCREMRILSKRLGGKPETLAGLSGFGDLMLTCTSTLSRNNRLGRRVAQGETVSEIEKSIGEAVEGVATAQEVVSKAEKLGILEDLPLYCTVAAVLRGELLPTEAMLLLTSIKPTEETFAD